MVRVHRIQFRPVIRRITRQPDASRRNRQRRRKRNLPDKQKRNQPSPLLRPIHLAQIAIRTARRRQRRAQFRRHQPIAHRQQRARNPPQQRLRPAHGAHHQRHGNERSHADHVNHVQRSRRPQPHPADESWRRLASGFIGEPMNGWNKANEGKTPPDSLAPGQWIP